MSDRRIRKRLIACLENLYEDGFPRGSAPYLAVQEAIAEIDRLGADLAKAEGERDEARAQAWASEREARDLRERVLAAGPPRAGRA